MNGIEHCFFSPRLPRDGGEELLCNSPTGQRDQVGATGPLSSSQFLNPLLACCPCQFLRTFEKYGLCHSRSSLPFTFYVSRLTLSRRNARDAPPALTPLPYRSLSSRWAHAIHALSERANHRRRPAPRFPLHKTPDSTAACPPMPCERCPRFSTP